MDTPQTQPRRSGSCGSWLVWLVCHGLRERVITKAHRQATVLAVAGRGCRSGNYLGQRLHYHLWIDRAYIGRPRALIDFRSPPTFYTSPRSCAASYCADRLAAARSIELSAPIRRQTADRSLSMQRRCKARHDFPTISRSACAIARDWLHRGRRRDAPLTAEWRCDYIAAATPTASK
jgi:hypothetical protein